MFQVAVRFLVALSLLVLPFIASAQKTLIVVVDNLTIDDLANPKLRGPNEFAKASACGLMNTALAGPRTDLAANLALAMGRILPAEEQDGDIFRSEQIIGHTTANAESVRRMGTAPVEIHEPSAFHLGVASLQKRFGANIGGTNRAFIAGPLEIIPSAALLALNSNGIIPLEPTTFRDFVTLNKWPDGCNILVAHLPITDLPLFDILWDRVTTADKDWKVIVVSPITSIDPTSRQRLSPILIYDINQRSSILTSPTTRTDGLVANIDLLPTIQAMNGEQPTPGLPGRPMFTKFSSSNIEYLQHIDSITTANDRAGNPIFVFLGIVCAISAFTGLWLLKVNSPKVTWLTFVFRWLFTMPCAMLLATNMMQYGAITSITILTNVGLWMSGIAVAATGFTWWSADLLAAIKWTGWLTLLSVGIDGYFGSPMLRYSVLEAYQLLGVRYYGIGNEYMGMMLGLALFIGFTSRAPKWFRILVFAATGLIIGLPNMGANAGGLIAAIAGFVSAIPVLFGKKWHWHYGLLATILGLVSAFIMAEIEKLVPASTSSHIGLALKNADAGGIQSLIDIAIRKATMNYRIASSPGVLTAIAGLAAAGFVLRSSVQSHWKRIVTDRPDWAASLAPTVVCAIAAFLFNDSGIVAAIYVFAAPGAAAAYLLCSPTTTKNFSTISVTPN
ncbi:MAG: hypothetical protein ABJA67_03770 [Chthonomonadales bacterium]